VEGLVGELFVFFLSFLYVRSLSLSSSFILMSILSFRLGVAKAREGAREEVLL
jgi:hypothetical protein